MGSHATLGWTDKATELHQEEFAGQHQTQIPFRHLAGFHNHQTNSYFLVVTSGQQTGNHIEVFVVAHTGITPKNKNRKSKCLTNYL